MPQAALDEVENRSDLHHYLDWWHARTMPVRGGIVPALAASRCQRVSAVRRRACRRDAVGVRIT